MAASFQGYVGIVRMLIDARAQVNTQDEVCTRHFVLHLGDSTIFCHSL